MRHIRDLRQKRLIDWVGLAIEPAVLRELDNGWQGLFRSELVVYSL